MTIICQEMFLIFKAIASLHNGGHAGYLGILMNPTLYATDYSWAFIPPMDPRDYPYLPTTATVHQKKEALVCHKQELLEYREYWAVVVCYCNQLQKTIHKDYLAELEDVRLGLAKKTPKEIFDHVLA